ncbi:TetR/AcrR family transcriptional regulator [Microbacterium hydrocarbonoxydans]|uniref:TetR/AcrR family transcriptional regulator n=1 Tax=Microbacterium hydrocarbonoxydans TaxID=273678 RepID=UPI0013DCBFE5|nr:TetR-like C-terminal domain-containing protein [Microbacterium hydrocarbonoxydans]
MTETRRSSYHHGDLRASLLTTAMRMLEAGEQFSLRAVAREAGVSPTAPYRHFTDRDALESALAAQGLRDLSADLSAGRELPSTPAELAELAVAYVGFALRRPALFRVMFGNACDEGSEERVRAATEIHDLLRAAASQVFPGADADAVASAGWALAHGMAYLHMDGKLAARSPEDVANHVRGAFTAIVGASAASITTRGDRP